MIGRPMPSRVSMGLASIMAIGLILCGCAVTPSPIESIANEGLAIMKRVNFESPPEAKLQTAQDLVRHALRYDNLAPDTTTATRLEAARFRYNERGAAATLMRDAAEDYETQGQRDRAHDVYQLILQTFTDERETHIRQSADTELNRLSGRDGSAGERPQL